MRHFEIREFQVDNKRFLIIFSTSYMSPLKYIKEIEKELAARRFIKQEVFFDFFLSNKNANERYASIQYNGVNFDKNTFKYIKVDKKDVLRKTSAEFYHSRKDELDFTFLTTIQKKMIFRGIAI